MQYLIRDAAHPMHAVMGIASLENCAVQITCRDDFIGWNQKAFIDNILNLSASDARCEFDRLLRYIPFLGDVPLIEYLLWYKEPSGNEKLPSWVLRDQPGSMVN